ncbi:MAG: TatD family hydrolase [Lachnospiraceae bacterium]
MIFDTHTHYDDEKFDEDRDELLNQVKRFGIGCVVDVAASLGSWEKIKKLTEQYPFVYGAMGVHPVYVRELNEQSFAQLREYVQLPKIVAVGEIGLDYYWDTTEHEIQRYWFERQLDLARELGKPVIIHSRDAAADTMEVMKSGHAKGTTGVVHCFSGSVEMAREYYKMGYYLGIGGVITFKNSKKLKEVVEEIDLAGLVLETDCPYLTPVPYRGKRNSSLYLPYVAEAIAQIKHISPEEVIAVTEENARRLYQLV